MNNRIAGSRVGDATSNSSGEGPQSAYSPPSMDAKTAFDSVEEGEVGHNISRGEADWTELAD